MEAANATTGDDVPGMRKRKWLSLKEDSEDESFIGRSATEVCENSATLGTPHGSDNGTSHKRPRLRDASSSTNGETTSGKLAKEKPRAPHLPLDVWQHICSFLEPVFLGRLICVDRALNALLDPQKPIPEHLLKKNLTQNDIWSVSRKRLLPGFPRPLSWISELATWKLLLGTSCQFCERKPSKSSTTTQSPWTSGPGQEGIRIVWPFAIRSCGKCLTTRMIKDADLRFSDISVLLPGLPYAYFTSGLNFVTSVALRANSPPLGLDLTRFYLQSQLDQLKQEMDHAVSLGRPAAEEWAKPLSDIGRQRMEDSKRLEHWEATGGLQALIRSRSKTTLPPIHGLPAKPTLPALSLPSVSTHVQATSNSAGSRTQSPLSPHVKPSTPGINHFSGYNTPHWPFKPGSPAPGQQCTPQSQSGKPVHSFQGIRGRPERSIGEVNQRKAERRTEIERRCLQLNPPIKASTLPYMDAFNNAMQIPMALNDNAWEVLKPRLVAQHEVALRKEEELLTTNQSSHPQTEQRREDEAQLRHAQTLIERQHDEVQRPVREKLAAYADELISSDWHDGAGVVKNNASQFAADLLIYVRRRFFEVLERTGTPFQAQGSFTPSSTVGGNTNRNLTLEDMKWVYENKIKPITQRYSKEIFLCGACDVDRKHYALDAVIQHFAAKHTHHFSHGTAVVYWKAEWPLEPPFDAKPIRSPLNRPVDHNGVSPMYQRDLNRPQHADHVAVMPEQTYLARSSVMMTPDVAPRALARYAASAYSVDEELYHPRGRLVPLQASIPEHGMYANGSGYETYLVPVSPVSPAFSARRLAAGPYRGHPTEVYQHPHSVIHYDSSAMNPAGQNGYGPQPPQVYQDIRLGHRPFIQPGRPAEFHQTQMNELAHNARDIWNSTDGIDGLPDSVRTHVIMHHVVHRFLERYTNEPTLTLFTDALLNTSLMRPLRSLQGLVCKSCTTQGNAIPSSDNINSQYKLPDLLKHFKSSHLESMIPPASPHIGLDLPKPDWKFDMVQLPDDRDIKLLIQSRGMTDSKLGLIATILWKCFEFPLPKLDRGSEKFRSNLSTPPMDESIRQLDRPASTTVLGDGANDYIPLEEHGSVPMVPLSSTNQDRHRGESATQAPHEDECDPYRPAALRLVHEYGNGYDLQEPRYAYPDRGASPPSYRLVSAVSPRRRYYDRDRYETPYEQDLAARRRYIRDEQDVGMRYIPVPAQDLRRPVRDIDPGLDDGWPHERSLGPAQQVEKEDERASPHNSTTGTTHFLQSFKVEGGPIESSLPDRGSNNASSNRTGRNLAGPRHLRDRLDPHDRPGTGRTSRKSTPRKPISRAGASVRSRSPSAARDSPRFPQPLPYLQHPANPAFDREPPQQAQYAAPHYLDRPIYEDELVPQHYGYRTRSPGPGMPLRYVEGRPPPRYGYSDDDRYKQPEREFVQVMPRGGHVPQHMERRVIPNNFPGYIEHGAGYNRAADERDAQAYHETKAPPVPPQRREVKYDVDAYYDVGRYK